MLIELTENPTKEELITISKGIKSYNQQFLDDSVVFEVDTKFAVFAKNEEGKVLGGIRARAYWNYCMIELLWLSEEARGAGIGTQLMTTAEQYALEKGFKYIRTETVSFQARPFYEKLGYQVYGALPDFPEGHTTYCVFKKL